MAIAPSERLGIKKAFDPYLIEHPAETIDHTREQQSKAEWEKRRNELKDYALSLKQEDGADGEATNH